MKIAPDLYDEEYVKEVSIVRRVWNKFVRVMLVVILAIIVGVGLYFGVPALVEKVVNPMQENILTVDELQDQVDSLETSNDLSESQLRERLVTLESELADQAETIADLQADLNAAEDDVEALTIQMDALSEMAEEVEGLTEALSAMTDEIDLLDQSVTSVALPASTLADRSQIVLSMILLTRARLWMEEDNLGLAAEDISAARDTLEAIDGQSEAMTETLQDVLDRLENALDDVRRYPNLAASELDTAWELLIDLAGPLSIPAVIEPTPSPTPTEDSPSE
jgi:chromosome segregation ATPase